MYYYFGSILQKYWYFMLHFETHPGATHQSNFLLILFSQDLSVNNNPLFVGIGVDYVGGDVPLMGTNYNNGNMASNTFLK